MLALIARRGGCKARVGCLQDKGRRPLGSWEGA